MREIKFRGKGKYGWVYGDLVHIHTKDGDRLAIKDTVYHVNDGYVDLIPVEIVPGTEGQHTGLHDLAGREIYESDIVKRFADSGTAQYPDEREIVDTVEFKGGCFYPVCEEPEENFEIIGNIYED